MTSQSSPQKVEALTRRTRSWAMADVLMIVLLFGVLVLIQYVSGAYHGEFGSHPDEAAHVVTGLMVYDYLTNSDWRSPLRFAEVYYLHYPKIALGHWPPLFYIAQALWMLFLGASRPSLLLFMAGLGAVLAWSIFRVACRFVPSVFAVMATVIFVCHPVAQQSTSAVMADLPLTGCVWLATLAFGRYLEGEHGYRNALLFAVLASLAILTKASGLLLVLVVGLSIVLSRRFACVKNPSLWFTAAFVLVVYAPFYIVMWDAMRNGLRHQSINSEFFFTAFSFFSRHFSSMTGVWVGGLALVGVWNRVVAPLCRNEAVAPLWAGLASLFVGTWAFHVLVPSALELRYLLPLLPAVVLFTADGAYALYQRAEAHFRLALRWRNGIVGVASLLVIWASFSFADKEWHGYGEVVRTIVQAKDREQTVMLVSSDPRGEGMLIAEVALGDKRPNHYVSGLITSRTKNSSNFLDFCTKMSTRCHETRQLRFAGE